MCEENHESALGIPAGVLWMDMRPETIVTYLQLIDHAARIKNGRALKARPFVRHYVDGQCKELVDNGLMIMNPEPNVLARIVFPCGCRVMDLPDEFTPDGYVYLAECSTGHYKIGRSIDPDGRIKHFDTQMPVTVSEVHRIECSDYKQAERALHEACDWRGWRVNGEWFDLPQFIVQAITNVVRYDSGDWYLEREGDVYTESSVDLTATIRNY